MIKKWLRKITSKSKNKTMFSDVALHQAELARAEEEVKILYNDFNRVQKFLHANEFFKHKKTLPLYAVIGHSRFGKTTLLSKSGLDLHDIDDNKVKCGFSTKYCVWLLSEQAIFLDTAGIYSVMENSDNHANLVWLGLWDFLQNSFGKNPLNGVIVVIDIPTLSENSEQLQHNLHNIRQRLYEIAQYTKNLPVYLVFTKLDVLTGFSDFFTELNEQEIANSLGLSFFAKNKFVNPQYVFDNMFADLLNKLQIVLKKRTQSVNELAEKIKIQEFFSQFASLKSALAKVLDELPHGGHIKIFGCFFVSSLQNENSNSVDNLFKNLQHTILEHNRENSEHTFTQKNEQQYDQQSTLANNYNKHNTLSYNAISAIKKNSKAYFIDNFFKKILLATQHTAKKKSIPLNTKHLLIGCVGLLLIGILSSVWLYSYKQNSKVFNDLKLILTTKTATPDIAKLEQAIRVSDINSTFWWAKVGLFQLHSTHKNLGKIYASYIAQDFTTQLQSILEKELTVTSINEYQHLYDTLKVYIMLSNQYKKTLDKEFIINWYKMYWQKQYQDNPLLAQQLVTRLDILLSQNIKITSSTQIINTTRELLNSKHVPKGTLVYSTLENQYAKQDLKFKFDDNNNIAVNKLYTADNLLKVYNKQIPQIAYELSKNNSDWVLMDDKSSNVEQLNIPREEMDKLIADLRSLYVKNYIQAWNGAIAKLQIRNFDDLKDMQKCLHAIRSNDYPLLSFIKIIQANLNVTDAPEEFKNSLNQTLPDINKIDIKTIYESVQNLSSYVTQISANNEAKKDAFRLTSERFKIDHETNVINDPIANLYSVANNQPTPIKEWLNALCDNTWQAMLNATRDYINDMWQASVIPEYNKDILDRYPFFKDAEKSVDINGFTDFFAKNGIMDKFFNDYLRSFVDTDQVYWTWKTVNNKTLGIGQDTLEVFIRSALIKKMFYSQNDDAISVKFTLIPEGLTPHTTDFTLNLGGQQITYVNKQEKLASNVNWPGNDVGTLTLTFNNDRNKPVTLDMPKDLWNWFRLLDKSNFQATENSTQEFNFVLDLNGNAIRYKLYSEQPINPFIDGVMNVFRCPKTL